MEINNVDDIVVNKKRYWLRFGIVGFLIPIIAAVILVFFVGSWSILIISVVFGFGIPFALDDMGFGGVEMFLFLIPFIWFFIGAIIGWIYSLIKGGNYKVVGKVFIIIAIIGTGIGFYVVKGDYGVSPVTKAVETQNIKICDKLGNSNVNKIFCYTEIGGLLKDYTICEQSTDEDYRGYCTSAVAEALGECEKMTASWESDQCYLFQSYQVRWMAKANDCSNGNPREQILCEQYIKKEFTDDDLCGKFEYEAEEDSYKSQCLAWPNN